MTSNQDSTKSILDLYAEASHDVELLTIFLQEMSKDPVARSLGMQKVIERAIRRAEDETKRLKITYESGGKE